MDLLATDLDILSLCAISAANQAGQYIAQMMDRRVAIQRKLGGDSLASQVVTEVDIHCQEMIVQILQSSIDRYDLGLLTEESIDDQSRFRKDYFWCVDPLDGTLAFVEKTAGYAVSIALLSKSGVPMIGVVYDPVEHTLYHAIRGRGAFRNGTPWQWKSTDRYEGKPFTFLADRNFSAHPRREQILEMLEQIIHDRGYSELVIETRGGSVMNACWTLERAPACFFKLPKPANGGGCLWDYAATACLFTEAVAVYSDMSKQPLELNSNKSLYLNHCGVLYTSDEVLAKVISDWYLC